jgi:hypothetical protein
MKGIIMEVEFIKDHKYYLDGNMKTLHESCKGDKIKVSDEKADRWIGKGVCKPCGSKPVIESAPKEQYENKMDSMEGKEEKAEAPKAQPVIEKKIVTKKPVKKISKK